MIGLPDRKTCFACESILGPIDGLMVTCSNRNCDASGKFQTCGFCRQFSLAMGDVTRICWNEECQSHNVPFTFCGQCRRYSVRLISGEHRCISRHCPSNSGQLEECFYCEEKSLFSIKGFKICFKSNCSRRGIQTDQCFFCQRMSFILAECQCHNPACIKFQQSIEPCEKCSQLSFPKEDFECLNPRCRYKLPMENFMTKKPALNQEQLEDLEESSDTLFDMQAVIDSEEAEAGQERAPAAPIAKTAQPQAAPPEAKNNQTAEEETFPVLPSHSVKDYQHALPVSANEASNLGSFVDSVVSQIAAEPGSKSNKVEAVLESKAARSSVSAPQASGAVDTRPTFAEEPIRPVKRTEDNAASETEHRPERSKGTAAGDPVEVAEAPKIISPVGRAKPIARPERKAFHPPATAIVETPPQSSAEDSEPGPDLEAAPENKFRAAEAAEQDTKNDIEKRLKDLENMKRHVLSVSEPAGDGNGSDSDVIFSDLLDEAWPGDRSKDSADKAAVEQGKSAKAPEGAFPDKHYTSKTTLYNKPIKCPSESNEKKKSRNESKESTEAPARFRKSSSWLQEEPKVHFRTKKPSSSTFNAPTTAELRRDSEAFSVVSADNVPKKILKATGEQGTLLEAYQLLNDSFLNRTQSACPFYLVIGLPGSGKTTYLSMLGDILYNRQEKYYFPYKDVTAQQIQIQDLVTSAHRKDRRTIQSLSQRLKDLVYDFSRPQYDRFLSRGFWPPFTGKNERFFLLTEILKKNQAIARVSTLEVAGEHYRDLLENALYFRDILQSPGRKEFALASMLNRAQGVLILLNPMDSHEDDKIYANFFRLIREHLKPRAMQALYETIQGLLANPRDFHRYRLHQKVRDALKDLNQAAAKGQRVNNQPGWERLFEAFKKVDKLGFEAQRREREQRLEPLRSRKSDSAEVEEQRREQRRRISREFDRRLLEAMARQIDDIVSIELKRVQNQRVEKLTEEMVLEALVLYHQLPANVPIELDQRASHSEFFPNLCRINIAITKADQYSICYPPHNYPRRRLRYSRELLAEVEGYLKLLGGELRYYNTSATGYTYILNNRYFPGTADFHCPINVVEPFFDMLDIRPDHIANPNENH
jgi:hypothetical protein